MTVGVSTNVSAPGASVRPRRRDRRLRTVLLLLVLMLLLGWLVSELPTRGVDAAKLAEPQSASGFSSLIPAGTEEAEATPQEALPQAPDPNPAVNAARQLIGEARGLVKKNQYNAAIGLLEQARPQLQAYAQAYLVLGEALEGRGDYVVARDFYVAALDRDLSLSDAYWGVATTSERLGELDSAIGAMRSYLHTEKDPDPKRLRINQARSAIWEWESKLGRGPWGPTKGIPPGFAAADLKRDGRGVGVKMPLLDTLQADGTMKNEIKHADKIKIYPRP
jgi:tetratricopeptide (TPR) repeat protein